ncbi:MAG TPA: hypothetical protein VGU61_19950 [Noviherbaspirillum sp.]|jgi:hypothetical protein|uniref:hypothetical protein n=1 Tax=Noviherbaspirillum sp. TaxID=1926288 RepID=UPI002DDD4070|nr:hypothetical protein [Noviherbaspirillum sp.]HEV2612546.1 hypothetical protein [Noviherbaspirillum sp.]
MELTPLPSLDRTSATFKNDVNTFFGTSLPQLVNEINTGMPDLESAANLVEGGLPSIVAAANYKGLWSTLTGALAIPASTFHNGQFWQLLENVADVTAEVPGVSSKWAAYSTKPTIPLGTTVAAGSLVAEDDSGNSFPVTVPSTSVIASTAVTDRLIIELANGNLLDLYSVSASPYAIVATVLNAATGAVVATNTISVGTQTSSQRPIAFPLTAGGFVAFYTASAGASLIAQRYDNSAQPVGAALTLTTTASTTGTYLCGGCQMVDGNVAFVWCDTSGGNHVRRAIYSADLTTATVAAGAFSVAISHLGYGSNPVALPAGGFAFSLSDGGTNHNLYTVNASGVRVSTVAISSFTNVHDSTLVVPTTGEALVHVFRSGSTLGRTAYILTGQTISNTLGSAYASGGPVDGATLAANYIWACALGDGTIGMLSVPSNMPYLMFTRTDGRGAVLEHGPLIEESTIIYPIICKSGINGFAVAYRGTSQFPRTHITRSGYLVGVSRGESGGRIQFDPYGEVDIGSYMRVNVGGAKVGYERRGRKIRI